MYEKINKNDAAKQLLLQFFECVYQILGRRTGRKQKELQIETTPIKEGWKACRLLCVVFRFNFSSG